MIEIYKNRVWGQRKKLQAGLRFLITDSIPIEQRLTEVFDGKYRVQGVSNNFLTKVLAVHDPMSFTVDNAPIFKALKKHFEYDSPRGYTAAEQYLEFARLMKDSASNRVLRIRSVDAFFYDFWERNIKNANEG